jgi:CubicO group peptidase (beta-lactamase class C family)
VSKVFTATALLSLFDQEKFSLDDDVNRVMPFPIHVPAAPSAPITYRQLLTHTASIKDNTKYINCPLDCPYGSKLGAYVTRGADSPIKLADLVRGYLTPGGAYYDPVANFEAGPPGTINDYSNMGITLAGLLVEVLGGTSLEAYSREHLFLPLGMTTTSWRLAEIDPARLAVPYDFAKTTGFVPYGQFGEPDFPDGMLRTSVIEIARFVSMVMNDGELGGQRVLRASTVQAMLAPQTPLDPDQGLAWQYQTFGDAPERRVVGHDGADNGAGAYMFFDPAAKKGVILMTNGIWTGPEALVARLLDLAFDAAD